MWYPSAGWTTQIPHHQQTIPLHNISTPQVSLHNTTSNRKHLKMDVLTSETCWAIYNKSKCHLVGQPLFKYQDNARSNTHKIHSNLYIDHFRGGTSGFHHGVVKAFALRCIVRGGLVVGSRCPISTLEDGTNMLSRNLSTKLPTHATQHPRRT